MKSFWIVFLGRILQMATAFVALRVMSTVLGPEEMGRLSIIVAATTFFALMFMNPAGMYFNRRLHFWESQGLLPKRLKTFSLFILAVAILALALVPLIDLLLGHPWPISSTTLASLVAGSLVFSTLNQTLIPSLNLLGHRTLWLIFSTLTLWISLAASLLLVHSKPSAELWQSGQIFGFLCGLALVAPWFFKSISKAAPSQQNAGSRFDADDSPKKIWAFTAPLTLMVGLNWCQFQSYRLYVGHWIALEDLGRFVGVYALIAGLMAAFENLIQQYFYPQLYSESTAGDGATGAGSAPRIAWRRYASVAIPTSLIGGFTLIAVGPALVRLMLAPAFQSAVGFVLVAAIVETARIVSNIYGMAGHVTLKTQTLLIPQVLGTALLFILVPVCFSLGFTHLETTFLFSLGLPSLALVAASAFIVAKKLHISLPVATLRPCAIAFLFAAAFGYFNASHVMSLIQLISISLLAVALFSGLMLWAVLVWHRNDSANNPAKVAL